MIAVSPVLSVAERRVLTSPDIGDVDRSCGRAGDESISAVAKTNGSQFDAHLIVFFALRARMGAQLAASGGALIRPGALIKPNVQVSAMLDIAG
jgi:hypothetical protein